MLDLHLVVTWIELLDDCYDNTAGQLIAEADRSIDKSPTCLNRQRYEMVSFSLPIPVYVFTHTHLKLYPPPPSKVIQIETGGGREGQGRRGEGRGGEGRRKKITSFPRDMIKILLPYRCPQG